MLHQLYFSIIFLCNFCLLTSAHGPYNSLGDIFQGQLANLTHNVPPPSSPFSRGSSYTHCCLLAVNKSLEIDNGFLAFKPGQTALKGTVSEFLSYQFPCTAINNGSQAAPPQVWITLKWCRTNCPGHLVNKSPHPDNWAEPLFAFFLPALIFCLNIPRRQRIQVPESMFSLNVTSIYKVLLLLCRFTMAVFLVTADTLVWLSIVLAMAGPIILSGIYEALLDLRILQYLHSRLKKKTITVQVRAQLLLVLLLGNLDEDPAWEHSKLLVSQLLNDNLPTIDSGVSGPGNNEHSVDIADYLFLSTKSCLEDFPDIPRRPFYQAPQQSQINSIKTKLKSMLDAQYSFGSSVGASVIFFTAGFCYTLTEFKSTYGSSATAQHLVVGMAAMIVPHVAVVSGLLLAGNNPNVWEGITSTLGIVELAPRQFSTLKTGSDSKLDERKPKCFSIARSVIDISRKLRYFIYRPVYLTQYQPVWIWSRGLNKAIWISHFLDERQPTENIGTEVLRVTFHEMCTLVAFPSLILVLVPTFLGVLVSVTTPMQGVTCGSGMAILYVCSQILLMILWIFDWRFRKRDSAGKFRPSTYQKKLDIINTLHYLWFGLLVVLGFLCSIGGTVFTLLGLYDNCVCFFPIQSWGSPNSTMYLSLFSDEQIEAAKLYWFPCGISATVFLIAVTYISWSYQRKLRTQFEYIADNIDGIETEDVKENLERDMGY